MVLLDLKGAVMDGEQRWVDGGDEDLDLLQDSGVVLLQNQDLTILNGVALSGMDQNHRK
jgi:hypothetical protein